MKKTPGCTESVSGWIPFFFLAFTFVLVMMAVEWAKKKPRIEKGPPQTSVSQTFTPFSL